MNPDSTECTFNDPHLKLKYINVAFEMLVLMWDFIPNSMVVITIYFTSLKIYCS